MDYENFNNQRIKEILSGFGNPQQLTVLYVSAYLPNYVRTETALDILRRNKIKVETILVGNKRFKYFLAIFKTILKLRKCDVIFLAFRSHEILPFFKFITRKPIIFDAFVSLYETLCLERKIFKAGSLLAKVSKWYDAYLCRIADLVLVDTKAHCDYFKKEFSAKNISYLYLECNKTLFKPLAIEKDHDRFVVFWYGKCWPLQGVDIILKAAKLLERQPEITFHLVGPVRKKCEDLVDELNPKNIEFTEHVPYEKLPLEIAKADLCLGGHFSSLSKAQMVIPGKAFQFIACGNKTILGDNSANRELFSEAENLYFVRMNSEEELAKRILGIWLS